MYAIRSYYAQQAEVFQGFQLRFRTEGFFGELCGSRDDFGNPWKRWLRRSRGGGFFGMKGRRQTEKQTEDQTEKLHR